jgi:hypothetical protein
VPILPAMTGYPLLLGHESAYIRLITTSSSQTRISSLDLAPFNPWTAAAARSPRICDLVRSRTATGRSRRILDLVSLRCRLSTIIRTAQVRPLYRRRHLRQLVLHLWTTRDRYHSRLPRCQCHHYHNHHPRCRQEANNMTGSSLQPITNVVNSTRGPSMSGLLTLRVLPASALGTTTILPPIAHHHHAWRAWSPRIAPHVNISSRLDRRQKWSSWQTMDGFNKSARNFAPD